MQSDVVIGIVGAVALVAVMAGVFAYEYNADQDAEWVESSVRESQTIVLQEGETEELTFEVDGADLATIAYTFELGEDVGDPDTIRVEVIDHEGQEKASSEGVGAPGGGSHKYQANPPEGRDAPDAWDGTETWTVRITLVNAPGTDNPVPILAEEDGEQEITVHWTTTQWVPKETDGSA